MPLTLTITSAHPGLAGMRQSKVFETRGGTIGRNQGNDWVLLDTERFISGSHAKVQYRDGSYFLHDTSTNGVFLNGSTQPIGQGNAVPLRDGDQISIGVYEILVRVEPETGIEPPPLAAAQPVVMPSALPVRPIAPEKLDTGLATEDPLAALDRFLEPTGSTPVRGIPASKSPAVTQAPPGPSFDQGSRLEDFFAPPKSRKDGGLIPADWDDPGFSSEASAPPRPLDRQSMETPVPFLPPGKRPSALDQGASLYPPLFGAGGVEPPERPNMPPGSVGQPPQLRQSPPTTPTLVATGGDGLEQFLSGAGLADVHIPPEQSAALMPALGGMFRELVKGLMDVLMARSQLKSEFRMSMTTVRPEENNPLKFSVDVEEALRVLLSKQGPAYLPPMQAVQEAVRDMQAHQIALMAGMQAAALGLLERFEPQAIERDAGRGSKLGTLTPAGRKAKAWDLYVQQYQTIAKEAEENLRRLIGEDFVRAYEERVARYKPD